MTFKSTLTKSFIMAILVAFAGNISAQVFWSEDFAGGLPDGWVSEDLSTNGAIWSWCGDPLGGTGDCSPIFDDQINGQSPFDATTSDNGFMTVNSDAFNSPVSNPHISQLTTTAIDCSAETMVFIKFEAHIGVFDLDATGNALLRVSTDGGTTYTDFDCFEGLTTAVRWSDNPEEVIFDLTDIAAGQSEVILQWQWTGGWEYFWNLDDIILTSENPTAPNDIQVNDNFFAIAPNAQTPISQIEVFGFLADVENVGLNDQPNVNLTVTIEDDAAPGTDIYTETLGYGTVMMDSLVENVLFPGIGFTPADAVASYNGEYNITSDSMDADLSNNTLTFNFEVTENTFAKDRGITRTISPAAGNWDDGESFSWAYGNFYHVVNGTGWWANEAVFGIGNAADIAGQTIFVTLYEWIDTNADGNADPDERTPVGSNTYAVEGTEGTTEADLITLPILDNNTLEQGVSLMDDTDYLLMLEYSAIDQTVVSFLASGDYDYGAQILRTQELGQPRFGSMLGVNDPLSSEPYSSVGFGTDVAPIARMVITDELTSSVAALSEDNKVNVFPSPASEFINVALELTEMQNEITINVMDATGKIIGQRAVNNVQNETYRFDVSTLPVGSYFLNLSTPAGNRNVPFVVQR